MIEPDTPVAARLAWIVEHAGRNDVTATQVAEVFSPDFLAQVPAATLVEFFAGSAYLRDISSHEVEQASPHALSLSIVVDGDRVRLGLAVERQHPHRIVGLRVTTAPTLTEVLDETEPDDRPAEVVVGRYLAPVAEPMAAGGMVVGVVHGDATVVTSLGDVPRDGIFDIGSITKVFTGILLAEMAGRDELALDDPVRLHLPDDAAVPRDRDREITLMDLATHTSGLPRLPPGFTPADPADPYADFTVERLYEALGRTTLDAAIGAAASYSNFGFGLLGHALERAAAQPFASLVVERVAGPLGLEDTCVRPTPAVAARSVTGYDGNGESVPWFNVGAIVGAGGIRSSIDDLVRFAIANIDPRRSPLAGALELAQRSFSADGPRSRVGLGWAAITRRASSEVIWHNGGTYGFRSFLAIHRESCRAVAVLCNNGAADLDAAAMAVLASGIRRAPVE